MADESIERLHERLLNNDDDLEAFKNDPEPLLQEHGATFTPEQVGNLKQRISGMDTATLRDTIQKEGLHAMV
jgi:hypothetical protein